MRYRLEVIKPLLTFSNRRGEISRKRSLSRLGLLCGQGILSVCLLLPLFLSLHSSAQRFTFRQYGSPEGLSSLSVLSLLQDHVGYLWVGTENGLFRYDGNAFQAFRHEEGLPNNEILTLAEAPDGILWVGTPTGLARSVAKGFRSIDLGKQGAVSSIAFDKRGRMYLSHSTGVLRGELDGAGSYRFSIVVPGEVDCLFVQGEDVWFSKGGDVWRLRADRMGRIGSPAGLPSDKWTAIITDSSGNLWVRSSSRLYRLPTGQSRFVNESGGLPHAPQAHLFADRHGRLFVSSDSGLVIYEGAKRIRIDSIHGLPSDAVGPILVDRDESLWMGMYGGGLVRRLGHGEWLSWRREDGLLHNTIWAVNTDDAGRVWLGNSQGLNLLGHDGRIERSWTGRNGLPGDRVLAIVKGPGGDIWAGTDPAGLARFNKDGVLIETFGPKSGLALDRIVAIAIDREQRIWVAGGGHCFRSTGAIGGKARLVFDPVPFPDGQLHPPYRYLFRDSEGNIWLASAGGLGRFDGSEWKIFTHKDGLEEGPIALVAQGEGAIWVSYRDARGITRLRLDGDSVQTTHFSTRNGLSSDQVNGIAFDASAQIWVATDNGVDRFRDGRWRHYGMEDGLIWDDTDIRALHIDAKNNVWIGTSNGLSRYSPLSYSLPNLPPTVVLTSIAGELREWQPGERPSLSYLHRSLAVRFTSLNYAYENRTRFLYRLRGYDQSWKEASGRSVNFASLPAGQYLLEIIAIAPDGLTSPQSTLLAFSIKQPWWETWWFLTACLILILFFARFVWRVRVSRLLTQKEQLEKQIAERTAELRESHRLLEEIAYIDILTSLPNRRMFTEEFHKRITRVQNMGGNLALLLVDLDRFKQINDSLGHSAGDAVLNEAANRLRAAVSDSDCVARVGGDEFGILLMTTHDLGVIEKLCQEILDSFIEGIQFNDLVLKTTPSIGIAIYPDHGDSQESLYKSADLALYEAKRAGRNGFCWYLPNLGNGAS